jgi:hypothetical protein
VRTHVVRQGETLWILATTYLGDGNRWREILDLNPSIRATRDLPVGDSVARRFGVDGEWIDSAAAAECAKPHDVLRQQAGWWVRV